MTIVTLGIDLGKTVCRLRPLSSGQHACKLRTVALQARERHKLVIGFSGQRSALDLANHRGHRLKAHQYSCPGPGRGRMCVWSGRVDGPYARVMADPHPKPIRWSFPLQRARYGAWVGVTARSPDPSMRHGVRRDGTRPVNRRWGTRQPLGRGAIDRAQGAMNCAPTRPGPSRMRRSHPRAPSSGRSRRGR